MTYRASRFAFAAFVLASVGLHAAPADATDAARVLESLEATQPNWLPSIELCPADVMPARETEFAYSEKRCESTPEECVRNCRAGNAIDCYGSAVTLQRVRPSPVAEALFLRACALGIMSGCTNRAASMDSGDGVPCAIRTFTAGCDRHDPWACTMMGMHLVRGIGIGKDPQRAKELLSRSCRFGETDDACRTAKGLMKEIGD